jgi:hypothetical protein
MSIVTFRLTSDETTDGIVMPCMPPAGSRCPRRPSMATPIRFAFLSPRTSEARVAEALDIVADVVGRA